jgi:lipoyl(octanoyl) transferase
MSYGEALEIQKKVLEELLLGGPETLLLVQHPPILTLGASFREENLLRSEAEYRRLGIDVVRTDRGGDVTYHGPGQLVVYPIVDLSRRGRDLHRYLRTLEQAAIETLASLGVAGERNPVNTGVWVGNRKVCAIGIKVRRWATLHGLALNCDVDLAPYQTIVPCGIRGDFGVTSLSQELDRTVTVAEVQPHLVAALQSLL